MDNKKYSVLIVEDEAASADFLDEYLTDDERLVKEGLARSGNQALSMLSRQEYDIVFMDIGLPGLGGLEVLKRLEKIPCIIFTTGHDTLAGKALEYNAVDYLVKPFSRYRIRNAVDRAVRLLQVRESQGGVQKPSRLSIRKGDSFYLIPFTEIYYLSSSAGSVVVHCANGEYDVENSLEELESKLPSPSFLRSHRLYTVNLQWISDLEFLEGNHYRLRMKPPLEISLPVEKVRLPEVKKALRTSEADTVSDE